MLSSQIRIPEQEISERIKQLQDHLVKSDCNGALILHHINLFYLSGTSQNGFLYVPASGDPVLMIRKSFLRAREESPIEKIEMITSPRKIPEILAQKGYDVPDVLGLELDVIPYNTFGMYQKVFPESRLVDISGCIKRVRRIKSRYEIDLLKKACAVIDDVFSEVPSFLREGMTEVELASLFEGGMRKRGYSGCCRMRAFNQDFYMGNIVSGPTGAVPTYFDGPVGGTGLTPANNPHGAGWKEIQKNEIVYIDYTCVVNGYTADEARMFVIGEPPQMMRDAHAASLEIQKELAAMLVPGVECGAIYQRSLELAAGMGYGDNFMGMNGDRVRFVGHGVGLELDEAPVFARGVDMKLEPGMTFALEPKFVFPEGAIGTENTFVMGENGTERLTHAPEDIIRV